MNEISPIIQIGDVLLSSDIITEYFCCDLDDCHGACCVEGDAGAPVTLDEVMEIEGMLDEVWNDLSASAQAVFASLTPFPSSKGEGSTNSCWLCMLEKAARNKANSPFSILHSQFVKPISCALYPIRVKQFSNGLVGLNYNRWNVCEGARKKGRELKLPVYRFLKDPLIRRFGEEWYQELCDFAESTLLSNK